MRFNPSNWNQIAALCSIFLAFACVPGIAWCSPRIQGSPESETVFGNSELTVSPAVSDGQSQNEIATKTDSADSLSVQESAGMQRLLIMTTIVVGAVLGLLLVLFVYLRLEHISRGFYSSRLQMVAIVCALAVLALSYFVYLKLIP